MSFSDFIFNWTFDRQVFSNVQKMEFCADRGMYKLTQILPRLLTSEGCDDLSDGKSKKLTQFIHENLFYLIDRFTPLFVLLCRRVASNTPIAKDLELWNIKQANIFVCLFIWMNNMNIWANLQINSLINDVCGTSWQKTHANTQINKELTSRQSGIQENCGGKQLDISDKVR